ncbi:MAG: YybH family protein [Erythrobacter sp.]|uniref:YybH family protein n=1 Tax=Erythrobacter sp. TaxID=1042 RepID=UPI003A8706C0
MSHKTPTILIAGAALALSTPALAGQSDETRAAITGLLDTYETALNAQDTDTIIRLYAEDGVFMPQHSSAQVGTAALQAAYLGVFEAITLNVDFAIDEIVSLSDQWAFARTHSLGTVTINATGESAPEGNNELFLFHRDADGAWKIARYIFSTTNPPRS